MSSTHNPPTARHNTPAILATLLTAVLALPAAASAEGTCPNEQLRQENNSTSLPDCRAYELVTPPFTDGQAVTGLVKIGADGNDIGYASLGGFGGARDDESSEGASFGAARSPNGWVSSPFGPAASQVIQEGAQVSAGSSRDSSRDLSEVLMTFPPSSSNPSDFRLYRIRPGAEPVEIGPETPPGRVEAWRPGTGVPRAKYSGATPDLSTVVFEQAEGTRSSAPWFWPGDPTKPEDTRTSLYEYKGVGNHEPALVAIKPGPEEARNLPSEHPALVSDCGVQAGSGQNGNATTVVNDAYNAVSSPSGSGSGVTVYFTAYACPGGPLIANGLYARLDGAHTVPVSEPTAAACAACDISEAAQLAAPAGAEFRGASADGSKVFFLSEQQLFDGDRGEHGVNLYEYDFDAANPHEKVSLIAPDMAAGEGEPGGVMRVSEDGSRVYLVSNAVLPGATENEYGVHAAAGAENLYVYDTVAHRTTFIAALAPADQQDWRPRDGLRPADATPDGRFLLFASTNDLTADSAGPGSQLYRYDAEPTAAETAGGVPQLVRVTVGDAASRNGNDGASYQSVYEVYEEAHASPAKLGISDDGSRVFFTSSTALTPGALDEVCIVESEQQCTETATNIYEYEDGHVYLLSDGRETHTILGSSALELLGASADGRDVFFSAADPLVEQAGSVPQQHIYDAREGGGFPRPPAPVGACSSECQGPALGAPTFQEPSSALLTGPGNLVPQAVIQKPAPKKPAACRKGFKRVKRRCVRKRAHRASRRGAGAYRRPSR